MSRWHLQVWLPPWSSEEEQWGCEEGFAGDTVGYLIRNQSNASSNQHAVHCHQDSEIKHTSRHCIIGPGLLNHWPRSSWAGDGKAAERSSKYETTLLETLQGSNLRRKVNTGRNLKSETQDFLVFVFIINPYLTNMKQLYPRDIIFIDIHNSYNIVIKLTIYCFTVCLWKL